MLSHQLLAALATRSYDASSHIVKRGQNDSPGAGIVILFVVNLVIGIPLFFYIVYTLATLIPTLGMVESCTDYQQVPLDEIDATKAVGDEEEEDDDIDVKGATKGQQETPFPLSSASSSAPPPYSSIEEPDAVAARPVTSSVRDTHRLLYSLYGWRSFFRGLGECSVYGLAVGAVVLVVSSVPFLPGAGVLGQIAGALLGVQLNTAWLHYVVAKPSMKRSFWRSIPPFRATFRALVLPTVIEAFASALSMYGPSLALRLACGVPSSAPFALDAVVNLGALSSWQAMFLLAVTLAIVILVQLPASVFLVRMQISLLPNEVDTMIRVDRSFGGAVANGEMSMLAVWKSCKGEWARLFKLFFKLAGIIVGLESWAILIVMLEFVIVGWISGHK